MTTERVLIVGAGIAGLTLARALTRRDVPFDLIDHVAHPAPVGAGIMINHNALRLLDALGFKDELRGRGQTFTQVLIGTSAGRTLQRGDASQIVPGAEVLGIHRAELHEVLSRGLEIRWGTTFTRWKTAGAGLAVTLSSGEERQYALVLGADGLDSSVRARIFPEVRPQYVGYPVPADDLLRSLRDQDVIHNDLYELPRHCWEFGRVALLGDAAHAMTPNLGQGAGMGIEDAIVLAEALRVHGLSPTALQAYAEARRTRVKTVADASRQIGWLGQLEHPVLRGVRDALLSRVPQSVTNAQSRRQLFEGAPCPPAYGKVALADR